MPGAGLLFAGLRAHAAARLRDAFTHVRGCFHFKTSLPLYPASILNLRSPLVLYLNKIIYRLLKWAFVPYTLICVTSTLLLSENNTTTLSYWFHCPTAPLLHFFFVVICWTCILAFNLCILVILCCAHHDKSSSLLLYLSLLCRFTGTSCFRAHIANHSCSTLHSSASQQLYQDLVTEETTDDFGAGDEVYDSNASVSVSTTSTAKRSTTSSRYNARRKNKGLLTTTTKSEAIWIELELERYPRVSAPLDEEDSLDNRDTDKVVSMKPNKTVSGSSLESDMAGTGAGALSKDHILALSGKAVVVSSLANIILTPEQAMKAMKAKNKMLKLRNSQKDVCICKGNCGAHFSLPRQRYLEYMMSTDELGEVVFTPYLGVGVAHKHIRMPPLKVFIVGSKAGNSKTRPGKTTTSRRTSDAKFVPTQLKTKLSIKDSNEEYNQISRMDKIVPLVPSVLTAPNGKRNLSPAPLPYTHNRSPEWSDLEGDKDRDKVCNKQAEHSGKYSESVEKPSTSTSKRSSHFDRRATDCNDKTPVSVSDWDDLSA